MKPKSTVAPKPRALDESSFEIVQCDCRRCVEACLIYPCRPTPEEVMNLIKAGHQDKLYLECNEVVKPKIIEKSGRVLSAPHRRCVFLTDDNKCSLHGTGLKPFEGRAWWHGMILEKDLDHVNKHVKRSWNTVFGEYVKRLFCK